MYVSEIEAKTDPTTNRTRLELLRRRVDETATSVEQRFKMHARSRSRSAGELEYGPASARALSAISCSININGPGIFNVIYEYVLKAMPP